MGSKCDWYDYENQKAISLPPIGIECEVDHDGWHKTFIVGRSKCGSVVYECSEFDDIYSFDGNSSMFMFRPLDHDKHQIEIVSLDWLVDSGIDCEFSDDSMVDFIIGELDGISDSGSNVYCNKKHWFSQCRPRMNHPIVLTDEQRNSIPDYFNIKTSLLENGLSIVTFKGLKNGYKYEWEA